MFSLKVAASLLLLHVLNCSTTPTKVITRVLKPRDHLVCDNDGWNCHELATCDNNFSDIPGQFVSPLLVSVRERWMLTPRRLPTAPSSTPSSAPSIPNPITLPHANATLNSDGSVATSKSKARDLGGELVERQILGASTIQWCDIGTTYYVLINPTTSKSSNSIKQLMQFALSQIQPNLATNSNQLVPSSSSPILQYSVSSGDQFSVYNLDSQFSWQSLYLAANLTNDWMSNNGYYQVAVQATNGSTNIGRIQIL